MILFFSILQEQTKEAWDLGVKPKKKQKKES
jgi:hypothetical protein